jgi:hypothetical protein
LGRRVQETRSLGEGTGAKASDNSEAPQRATASRLVSTIPSMSCPHCAAFGENVFPMLRSKYIDTGKVRFVFREFPLDIKAAAASMLARCIADGDAESISAPSGSCSSSRRR